jgi:hypothetical protein
MFRTMVTPAPRLSQAERHMETSADLDSSAARLAITHRGRVPCRRAGRGTGCRSEHPAARGRGRRRSGARQNASGKDRGKLACLLVEY